MLADVDADRIRSFEATTGTPLPRVLFVNVTRLCNVDCARCYLTPFSRKTKSALPVEWVVKALSDPFFNGEDGPVLVILQGGEPQVVGRAALNAYADAVFEVAPHARQSVVTNMLNAPTWLFDLAHRRFGGRIETTWSAGRKATLDGNESVYQQRFAQSLSRAVAAGINCPVNVELNPETVLAGPDVLLDMMEATGALACDFDLSFDFLHFRESPRFAPGFYPLVPPSTPYAAASRFLLDFRRRRALRGLSSCVLSHNLVPIGHRGVDMPFNTCSENRFVTINPDGSVTTIPLYSDIEETYIGNIGSQTLSEVLQHPNRALRAEQQALRLRGCVGCAHLGTCAGGPGHAPVWDGSGECAGLRGVLDRL